MGTTILLLTSLIISIILILITILHLYIQFEHIRNLQVGDYIIYRDNRYFPYKIIKIDKKTITLQRGEEIITVKKSSIKIV